MASVIVPATALHSGTARKGTKEKISTNEGKRWGGYDD